MNRVSKVVHAEYVTTKARVWCTPRRGMARMTTNGMHNKLEIYCPAMANGRFERPCRNGCKGKGLDANKLVIEKLAERRCLRNRKARAQLSHDWRSKTPTIFRRPSSGSLRWTSNWRLGSASRFRMETARPSSSPGGG
jgi:isoleucyl-tRNA synthetase